MRYRLKAKSIKKIVKISVIVLLVIISLPTVGFFILKNPGVQTTLAGYLTKIASEHLNAKVTVGRVDYRFFNRIVLKDAYIEDQYEDTLIFAKELETYIKHIDLKKKQIDLRTALLKDAKVYVEKKDSIVNIKFFTDALKRKDTTVKRVTLNIQNIRMKSSKFRYRSNKPTKGNAAIDFSDMNLNGLDVELENFNLEEGTVNFYIDKLEFIEESGFTIFELNANTTINKKTMAFRNLSIRTPNSFFASDSLIFRQNSFKEYKHFTEKVKLNLSLSSSNISFKDISYFSSSLRNIPVNIIASGRFYGSIAKLRGREVRIRAGHKTQLTTDFSFDGLPNFKETFMFVDVRKFVTNYDDFDLIHHFLKREKPFEFPENLKYLGDISYKGNFTGFLEDFVTYGSFTTDLGKISTDILLKPSIQKELLINGNLKTNDFRIGKLANTEKIGMLSMNAELDGRISKERGIHAVTAGKIESIEINDYLYQNIDLDGFLTSRTYNGLLKMEDPNIDFSFNGSIDFSDTIPVFNFKAEIPRADLAGLKIDQKDSVSLLSTNLMANFTGNSIDNASGDIIITNTRIEKRNQKINTDTIKLIAAPRPDSNRIELQSEFIHAQLVGKYQSTTLKQSFKNLIYAYIPSLINEENDSIKLKEPNNFSLQIHIKKSKAITSMFYPSITISPDAKIRMLYSSNLKRFFMEADFDEINYKSHSINQLSLNSFSNDTVLTSTIKSNEISLAGQMPMKNITLSNLAFKNLITSKVSWNNKDSLKTEGDLLFSTYLERQEGKVKPVIKTEFIPSKVYLKDSLWRLEKSTIIVDSSSISVENFSAHHLQQQFSVDGKISENPNDTLFLNLRRIKLQHANLFTEEKNISLQGNISGTASFANIYNNPLFHSDISIDSLIINNEGLGKTQLSSEWLDNERAIVLGINSQRGDLKTLDLKGFYYPSDRNINIEVTLDKVRLPVLEPFLSSFASEVRGMASGTVALKGTINKPVLSGELALQKSSMVIDYIKTRYNFTDQVTIRDNRINFTNTTLFDAHGNNAKANGYVDLSNLKNLRFDFTFEASNILALNTTGLDNDTYYGTAFMSGIINLEGNPRRVNMGISGRTEKNTRVYIPLSNPQEAKKIDFLQFVNTSSSTKQIISESYEMNFTGFTLEFDLEVTPEAEAQLIFDSKIGDIIKARGEGNLKMEVNEEGAFNMFGEYNIVEGDYLFTLQNVINKKFEIEEGSKILWNGEPYDAGMDVKATYNLKAPLSGLLLDTSDYYKRRIPIECQIFLTEKLTNPNIRFDIFLPSADEDTRTRVNNVINTQEKLNKQFLSLLVINNFLPDQSYTTTTQPGNEYASGSLGITSVTTSELLSNQLSHWLSQISDEWDIGVNYRPGDEISKDQVEVALSTQLLNDRLSINGNLGYGGQNQQRTSDLVGDFNVDFKLNKSGKLRVKAFNESNDKLIYEESPYTQGVGILYQEEFNSFEALFRNFWSRFKRNKKTKEEEEQDEQKEE